MTGYVVFETTKLRFHTTVHPRKDRTQRQTSYQGKIRSTTKEDNKDVQVLKGKTMDEKNNSRSNDVRKG